MKKDKKVLSYLGIVLILAETLSYLKVLKIIPTAAMSNELH